MITKITDHVAKAKARLLTQFKNLMKLPAIVGVNAGLSQEDEDTLWDMLTLRDIYSAVGVQLDGIGSILGHARQGLDDDTYRIRLFLVIAQHNSQGRPEDLINLYKNLMRADYVFYQEEYPATVIMEAVNPNPIGGDLQGIKAAMNEAKPAGVKLFLEETDGQPYFAVLEDTDPNTDGAGDQNDPTLGGIISSLF